MKLDPHTTVVSLLTAIPSSTLVFDRMGIAFKENQSKSLQEVCSESGVRLEDFLQALDEIDWTNESPIAEVPDLSSKAI